MSGLEIDIHLPRSGQALHAKATIPGGITAVCGISGSGKTSLLRCLAGLEPGVRGTVQVGDVAWLGGARPLPPHRRGIGFCFQDSRVLSHLTVRGNLRYPAWARWLGHRHGQPPIAMEEIVERLGLGSLLPRFGRRLSGGEARRVALGRALLTADALLLLDEPFVGLETSLAGAVRALIADFHVRSGIPVLLATHGVERALALTDRLLLMDGGYCLACGPADDLLCEPTCAEAATRIGLSHARDPRNHWQAFRYRTTLG